MYENRLDEYRPWTKVDWTNPGLDENGLDKNRLVENELDEKWVYSKDLSCLLSFSIYKKPSLTDKYLDFESNHPLQQKFSVMQ